MLDLMDFYTNRSEAAEITEQQKNKQVSSKVYLTLRHRASSI